MVRETSPMGEGGQKQWLNVADWTTRTQKQNWLVQGKVGDPKMNWKITETKSIMPKKSKKQKQNFPTVTGVDVRQVCWKQEPRHDVQGKPKERTKDGSKKKKRQTDRRKLCLLSKEATGLAFLKLDINCCVATRVSKRVAHCGNNPLPFKCRNATNFELLTAAGPASMIISSAAELAATSCYFAFVCGHWRRIPFCNKNCPGCLAGEEACFIGALCEGEYTERH